MAPTSAASTTTTLAVSPTPAAAAAATPPLRYCEGLRAAVQESHGSEPAVPAPARRVEWAKVLHSLPLEINPSVGSGYKVMTAEEWAARWKTNPDFPACLACSSTKTKEHYFTQTWCRGKRAWESEALCLDCLHFSRRVYRDPDFKTPEQYEKEYWTAMARQGTAPQQ